MVRFKNILLSVLFALVLFGGGLWFLLSPKPSYSETERRLLHAAPVFTAQTVRNGVAFSDLSAWMTDRFPERDSWRRLNVRWLRQLLRQPEADGYVLYQDSIIKLEKEVNTASLAYAGERFQALSLYYLSGTDCSIYAAVIPDKSHFLSDAGYPVMDFEEMESLFFSALPDAAPISLTECLTLESYYRTDSHWRQECLLPAADVLLEAMNTGRVADASPLSVNRGGIADASLQAADDSRAADELPKAADGNSDLFDFSVAQFSPFYGVYAGQSALDPDPEEILWFTGGYLDNLRVTDLETHMPVPLTDPEGCDQRDLYTLFLGGGKAVLRIENPAAESDRELVVFRDSFGAAIAPLLAANYRTVTLIDPRYIAQEAIGRYVRFTDQDVLFLFSATLLNNSSGLR